MKIKESVYRRVLNEIPCVPPESGGVLGGTDDIISVYCFDMGIKSGEMFYWPDVKFLNAVLRDWHYQGIQFYGIFHSHIEGGGALSEADMRYAMRILSSLPDKNGSLLFPVVIPRKQILFYRGKVVDNKLMISEEIVTCIK